MFWAALSSSCETQHGALREALAPPEPGAHNHLEPLPARVHTEVPQRRVCLLQESIPTHDLGAPRRRGLQLQGGARLRPQVLDRAVAADKDKGVVPALHLQDHLHPCPALAR
eukprot:TRINITY_DN2237_c0_g1_i1.p3 TRINITY_DN2237_c0_g1~~TRINITY_DN2237_c0_g1_i1.p3  ORF type:complete len:112 (-),score=5.57 TRINITY_DN2237_c0_g1_i1:49-384(-)